jgi:hypothetical protein
MKFHSSIHFAFNMIDRLAIASKYIGAAAMIVFLSMTIAKAAKAQQGYQEAHLRDYQDAQMTLSDEISSMEKHNNSYGNCESHLIKYQELNSLAAKALDARETIKGVGYPGLNFGYPLGGLSMYGATTSMFSPFGGGFGMIPGVLTPPEIQNALANDHLKQYMDCSQVLAQSTLNSEKTSETIKKVIQSELDNACKVSLRISSRAGESLNCKTETRVYSDYATAGRKPK